MPWRVPSNPSYALSHRFFLCDGLTNQMPSPDTRVGDCLFSSFHNAYSLCYGHQVQKNQSMGKEQTDSLSTWTLWDYRHVRNLHDF